MLDSGVNINEDSVYHILDIGLISHACVCVHYMLNKYQVVSSGVPVHPLLHTLNIHVLHDLLLMPPFSTGTTRASIFMRVFALTIYGSWWDCTGGIWGDCDLWREKYMHAFIWVCSFINVVIFWHMPFSAFVCIYTFGVVCCIKEAPEHIYRDSLDQLSGHFQLAGYVFYVIITTVWHFLIPSG